MEGLVLLATAFISIAAILWVVVAKLKLASNSSKEEAELASAMTQFDEAGSPEDLLTSAQHPHVTSKWNILEKFGSSSLTNGKCFSADISHLLGYAIMVKD